MPNPRLDAAYAAQNKAIRLRVKQFTTARFAARQYRDADLAKFVKEVVPVVLAGRRQVSSLTDAYLAQVLASSGIKLPPRPLVDTAALRGIDATEVYARPFVTVRTKLSDGLTYEAAVNAGMARLTDIVLTDMQLAKTHSARNVFESSDRVKAFERTLTGSINCALCYVASTQRYHRGDLMPIHPGCDCGVSPILDTGEQVINPERLQASHEAVEDRLGASDSGARTPDYRKQIIVQEHGEIGPVLTVKGQHFQGASVMDN